MSSEINANERVKDALLSLTKRYLNEHLNSTNQMPIAVGYNGLESPCIQKIIDDDHIAWRPVLREQFSRLDGVQRGMEMLIHDDIHTFYGLQYSADIPVLYNDVNINLLQVWSDEDYIRLQENMIGHLVSQRKAKRTPSVFLGTTDDDNIILSCCNLTGEIHLESLFKPNKKKVSNNLCDFLNEAKIYIE